MQDDRVLPCNRRRSKGRVDAFNVLNQPSFDNLVAIP